MDTICNKDLQLGVSNFFVMTRDRRNLIPGNQSKHGHLLLRGGGVAWLLFVKKPM